MELSNITRVTELLEAADMEINRLNYELGRWKKAVETREKIIAELEEKIAGYEEITNILSAYMVKFISDNGEVIVEREELKKIIKKYKAKVALSEDERYFKLSVEQKENVN